MPVQERDLSMRMVIGVTLASMLPIGLLLWLFVQDTPIAHHAVGMVVVSILFVLLIGLAVAGVCGYMAGLIGASNSPISGVGDSHCDHRRSAHQGRGTVQQVV